MKKIGFEITSVTDKVVGLKLPIVALEDLLNESITLSNYGIGIGKIFIIFIAVPPANTIHEEHVIYTEEERHLEVAVRLDYKTVLKADSDACMSMMKNSVLDKLNSSCEVYSEDFDWRKFIEAIAKF